MKKPGRVREPIQVYLDRAERSRLDRLARELGVSRAEVLRRGLDALGGGGQVGNAHPLDDLVGAFDNPEAPTDLAERHDEYLVEDLERKWHDPGTRHLSS